MLLVHDGLVASTSRGFSRPHLSQRDMVDLFEIRRLLEPAALAGPKRLASFSARCKGIEYQLDALGVMLIPALEIVAIMVGAAKAGYEFFLEQAGSRKPFHLPCPTFVGVGRHANPRWAR